ncbi:hypothetical protein SLEP1_g35860 [Rubroshorea leprosula]|uniref:PB1 domain-containing protein n=1 Tax=Rubroshorea leprosula TaxID=152421 RepID=A0AAV5KPN7_9ROSI|nr:hypothetical protein SLEP1_g35860 [Rubroshorea leprosula]
MENYPPTYNSYPDSGNSSPRSREIEFENPPPWEDQNFKAKFMCSYGGKIQPRPHDNQLSYIGGETKILSVDRSIKFSSMISKLSALCGGESEVSFKYQLPGEDLDALISVTNDDDLDHMMLEYDRMYRPSAKPARMRLFVFPVSGPNSSFSSDGGKSERERFVEALNSSPGQGPEKNAAVPQNNVDFLFGLEKGMTPPPPVKVHAPVPEVVAQPSPPPPTIPEVVVSDHVLNSMEVQRQLHELQMQRMQIREPEPQVMYRKKSDENNSVTYAGEYYAQKLPEKAPPVTLQMAVQQQVPAPAGYWPEKQIPAPGYPPTVPTGVAPTHPSEHQVYMIPAPPPGTVYHAHSPIPTQAPAPAPTSASPAPMVRQVMTGQPSQGYYTNVQRMPPEVYREHPVYNVAAAAPNHPPQISSVQQQMMRQSGGVNEQGYTQIPAYDRQVYYTAPGGMVLPPQYQGVGVPVSGEMRAAPAEGKVVTKVSQASV